MREKTVWLWIGLAFVALLAAGSFGAVFWLLQNRPAPPAATAQSPTAATVVVQHASPSPAAPTPTAVPSPLPVPSPAASVRSTPCDGGYETAQRLAQAVLPERDLVEIAGRLLLGGEIPKRAAAPLEQPYAVGHKERFWVTDLTVDVHRQITATLQLATPLVYVFVEEGAAVDHNRLEQAIRTFEEEIYPTNHRIFGSEWNPGVDGDPHIVILHAYFEGAAGYYSSLDEIPRSIRPHSNQHEMFYMNLDAFEIGSDAYISTLAHEFQHMIHWHQDPRSDTWLNEGLAQMAELANGFGEGPAWAFLSNPDLQLTTWARDPFEAHAHYGCSYLWSRYFGQCLGGLDKLGQLLDRSEDDLKTIDRLLEAAGYQPAIPAPRPFDAFFADWAVANYLNDPTVADGRYAYDGYVDLGPIGLIEWVYDYELPWETSATVQPYGTDYIEITGYEESPLHIRFDGAETLPLVDTKAHSGTHMWWGNRGDLADARLTRAFDLSAVDRATLRCHLWYDIEPDYDYAYIEVSTDGGDSWTILAGRHSTDSNPNGSNLGHGYTGTSGPGVGPSWVEEQIDLSPFAGQQILLRFEMITDDALNSPGLVLDDVEIPEIGFYDDLESEAGWLAEGFVWVDDQVPVDFLVQLVIFEAGGTISVQALELDGDRFGEIVLSGFGREIWQVTVVISAAAPATTESAPYYVSLATE